MMKTTIGMMVLPLLAALTGCAAAPGAGGGAAADGLEGTSWTLTELNGAAAVSGGGVPTLEFAAGEPRVSGNASCNRFSGFYTHSGDSVRFGPLASTRMACADAAANTQETAYLRVLETTTRYTVSGDVLTLYVTDRAVAQLRRSDA
jgi:heat shock protein HslJ